MTPIDLEFFATLFEVFWWFSIGIFFVAFIVKLVLNFFNR